MRLMKILIVGGTSGLGLSLAKQLKTGNEVYVASRNHGDPAKDFEFQPVDLSILATSRIAQGEFGEFLKDHVFDMVIIAAGYYQEGRLDDLTAHEIREMVDVGLVGPAILLKLILVQQKKIDNLIVVTSTSQWTPRLMEPVYTAAKGGLAMLTNSLSLDPRIGSVLLAAPAGMATPFWDGTDKDTSTMLDPDWVAAQIIEQFKDVFEYRFVKILRFMSTATPPEVIKRVDVIETRVKE